jgi:hypothetical protein
LPREPMLGAPAAVPQRADQGDNAHKGCQENERRGRKKD